MEKVFFLFLIFIKGNKLKSFHIKINNDNLYQKFKLKKVNLNIFFFHFYYYSEDETAITSLASHTQTSSPQPSYALNSQNSNFMTSHMLGQTYAADQSNFGPLYHHHSHHHNSLAASAVTAHHGAYGSPYEKYKVPASPHHTANPYSGHYQGFYGHHQMVRQADYIPR